MDKNLVEGQGGLIKLKLTLKQLEIVLKMKNIMLHPFFRNKHLEKALKGFLYSKGFRALITHSVLDLVVEASKFNTRFNSFMDFARELGRHYIGSRHPNAYPSGAPYRYYTSDVAKKCVSYAESILIEELFESIERYKNIIVEKLKPKKIILFAPLLEVTLMRVPI